MASSVFAAPVLLRILLRVRVLERDAERVRGVERRELGRRQRGAEVGVRARGRRVAAHAVLQVHGVGRKIVRSHPRALVGVGDRASALQAPLASRADRTVNAARARGRRRHDARPALAERCGDLHHQRDVQLPAAVVRIGDVLGAGDLAFAQRVGAGQVDVRTVQRAEAPLGIHVEQGAIVVVDREPSQLRRRRRDRVREYGRRGGAEPRLAEPRGQQVVAHRRRNESWRSRRGGMRVARSLRASDNRCSSSRRSRARLPTPRA